MKLSNVSLDLKSLVLGAVVGAVVMLSVAAETTTGVPSGAKWDYKVADLRRPVMGDPKAAPDAWRETQRAFLNEFGKDGWELVSETEGTVFFFKRSL